MYDYDPATVLSTHNRVAKKDHKCNECRRTISSGEKYLLENYVFEGRFYAHKTCVHCQKVRECLIDAEGYFVYGNIEEDLRCSLDYDESLRTKLMLAGMARCWKRKDGKMWRVPK